MSNQCPYVYGYSQLTTSRQSESQIAQEKVRETFGTQNIAALLVPKGDYDSEKALLNRLEPVSYTHLLMARVTGTGCMQGAVVAVFLAVASPLEAALSGAAAMGLAGEYAAEQFQSHGSISQFSLGILDGLFSLRDAAALRMIPL